ncbi:hypothetical protein K1719_004191 [Acacia pycnantha]|nr:hypothetical protein K1719_004191 [Acacia pycnantha]
MNGRYKVCHQTAEDVSRTSPEALICSANSMHDIRSVLTDVTNIPSNCSSIQSKANAITDENNIVDTPSTDLNSSNINRKSRTMRNTKIVNQVATDLLKRINEFKDEGDAVYECQFCGANMWHSERLKRLKKSDRPQFNICCGHGNIIVPLLQDPPEDLCELFFNKHLPLSKKFFKSIRLYNNMFCFTSMGGRVDHSINSKGGGPYSFVLSGQNHHFIGSLLPSEGNPPVYAQLYIYDTDNEVSNRISTMSRNGGAENLDPIIVNLIKGCLDKHNSIVKHYRTAVEIIKHNVVKDVNIRLIRNGNSIGLGRQYNMPTAPELVALIVGDFDNSYTNRDIIVKRQSGALQRIDELHMAYLPLQLLKLFHGHLNVEKTNQSCAIKYLFKYISKGHDRVIAGIYDVNDGAGSQQEFDEISHYLNCRMSSLLNNPRVKESMFLAWMEKNKDDSFSRTLSYSQFPNYFTFVREKRICKLCERGFSVGRLGHCTPAQGELYYLRLLLTKVRGPKNYTDIMTVNNVVYSTFREACYALGLLDDDKEYIDALKEASLWASGNYLRKFFTSMLLSYSLSQPTVV